MTPDSPHPEGAEISREALPQSHLVPGKGAFPPFRQFLLGLGAETTKKIGSNQGRDRTRGEAAGGSSVLSLLWEFPAGSSLPRSASQGMGRDLPLLKSLSLLLFQPFHRVPQPP